MLRAVIGPMFPALCKTTFVIPRLTERFPRSNPAALNGAFSVIVASCRLPPTVNRPIDGAVRVPPASSVTPRLPMGTAEVIASPLVWPSSSEPSWPLPMEIDPLLADSSDTRVAPPASDTAPVRFARGASIDPMGASVVMSAKVTVRLPRFVEIANFVAAVVPVVVIDVN